MQVKASMILLLYMQDSPSNRTIGIDMECVGWQAGGYAGGRAGGWTGWWVTMQCVPHNGSQPADAKLREKALQMGGGIEGG